MHSPHARPHRSLPLLALLGCTSLVLGASVSCADDGVRIEPSPGLASPPRTVVPVTTAQEPDAQAPEPPAITVSGTVTDDLDTPIVGRPLTVVDRRGRRQEVLTDEEGIFWLMEVAPPYDVLVDAAPAGAVITPLVYLGLQREHPRLEVFERQGPMPRPASQLLRVSVQLPACHAADGTCWVSVVASSPSGGGATAGSYTAAADAAIFTLDHVWREPTTPPDETLTVHVLVGDADYAQYLHGSMGDVAARPGETTDVGVIVPVHVDSTEPVTVAAQLEGLPEGWQWTLSTELGLPDGAALPLRYEASPSAAMRLPKLPGATWQVGAWAQRMPTPDRPDFHRSSQAWSGTLPLSTTDVALDLPSSPDFVRPALQGALSRRARGIAWDARDGALAAITVTNVARGKQCFKVFTAAAEVSLARLEELGLPRLDPGEHVIDLTTTPGATVDELAEPDPLQRRERFDQDVAGGATYQRFDFKVTP